jgi:pimeloyl-ACP methyl ester carboxylesterase
MAGRRLNLPALRILPGLDGTARMLSAFVAAARAAGFEDVHAIAYPPDRILDYAGLETFARAALPHDSPCLLLGESFSGPVALAIAADPPPNLCALALSTTFAKTPLPALRPLAALAGIAPVRPLPMSALAWLLLGRWATPALRRELGEALATVSPAVLRARAACALRADADAALPRIAIPTLYLRGDADRLMPRAAGDRILAGIAGARLTTLAGPHLLLQAAPERSAAALAAFARRIGPTAGLNPPAGPSARSDRR